MTDLVEYGGAADGDEFDDASDEFGSKSEGTEEFGDKSPF